jgi:hypothetical protein
MACPQIESSSRVNHTHEMVNWVQGLLKFIWVHLYSLESNLKFICVSQVSRVSLEK